MNATIEPLRVPHLQASERFWLWAIRAWSAFYSDLTCVWWSLDRAFTREGIPTALLPFHDLMSALFAEVRHWPDIRCVICPRISQDEMRLIDALACLQQGDDVARARSCRNWCRVPWRESHAITPNSA